MTLLLSCGKPCPEKVCPEMICQTDDVKMSCPPDMDEYARGQSIEGQIPHGGSFVCRGSKCLVCVGRPKPLKCHDGSKPVASNIPFDGGKPNLDKYGWGRAICIDKSCIFCKE